MPRQAHGVYPFDGWFGLGGDAASADSQHMIPKASIWLASLFATACAFSAEAPLSLSVYATAADVLHYLVPPEQRLIVPDVLQALTISRVFLEGRRGDEYVPPTVLREVRDFLTSRGFRCAGGIATVPGKHFGARQNGGLGWLDWESEQTRRDVAGFFGETAPVFEELIVDDFFCTGDTSPESEAARGQQSWGEYRRDLLVSLIEPLILRPARAAHPGVRLILKYPQWYDRFHLFGYDPARMSPAFDQIWVGTEVRDPQTRRMGFVQPTEGYMNFRWLASVAGEKVEGAWFDHIECSAQNFVDQAYQSVLAGARELTLFHLGDLMDRHPGDALLANRLTDLRALAEKIRGQPRAGIVFYKPPSSDAGENLYLADYLGMIGLPVLPEARYPEAARVLFLARQAATDAAVLSKIRHGLEHGATVILTPDFVRAVGSAAGELAGVAVESTSQPATTREAQFSGKTLVLPTPLDLDTSLRVAESKVRIEAKVEGRVVPFLTERTVERGRVLVLNVRTFSEQDFRDSGEWLLAPKPRGLSAIPQALADALRDALLAPLGVDFHAPAGVGLYLFAGGRCLYNFQAEPVRVRLEGASLELPANGWLWRDSR